jgi:RND family efflux transporter MFP subunit
MRASRTLRSLLTLLVILGGVGSVLAWRIQRDAPHESGPPPNLPDTTGVEVASAQAFGQRVPVRGVAVAQDTLWIHVVASGHAEAYRRSAVATRASGVIMGVAVRENQRVQAGDLLIQLDTLEAALDLAQARAGLVQAQADFAERMLFSGDLLDPIAREERARIIRALSGLDQAEITLRRAESAWTHTQVRAPFSGRVADLRAMEGAFIGSGAEVLTLVQLSPIRVEVNVGAGEIGYLEQGRTARVRFAAIAGEQFVARVASVNPLVEPESGSSRVTLVLENPEERIKPGMFAWASLDARSYPDRILIPREALLERNRRPMVFVASAHDDEGNGLSEWRYVTPGHRNETHVEILLSEGTAALRAGEIVLVDGHHTLAHQVPIRLVDNVAVSGGRPGR